MPGFMRRICDVELGKAMDDAAFRATASIDSACKNIPTAARVASLHAGNVLALIPAVFICSRLCWNGRQMDVKENICDRPHFRSYPRYV
jgi:hypothetical protein